MECILKIMYYAMFITVFLYGAYFAITGLFLFKKNKNKIGNHKSKFKFGIIIAARNEEAVIGNLINSLKSQNYDKELYEIFVIPNNCTDNTEKISKKLGATIIKCSDKTTSKGEVLKYTFDKLKKRKDIDAYLIFDSDNVVHPNFIKRMNDALCENHEVAQGFRDCKNPSDNWICGSYSLFYWGQNIFYSKARMSINRSASINGTGFMIKKSVIDKIGFNTKTITEDIEFTAICALNNIKIVFVDDAITYDEQPTDFFVSWKQRSRWSKGTFQCLFKYSKQLFKKSIKTNDMVCFDMSLFFMAPLVQIIGFILFMVLTILSIYGIELNDFISTIFSNGLLLFVITSLVFIIVEVFVIIYNKKRVSSVLSGIIMFSIFMLTWIPINIACIFKKNLKWSPVIHSKNISVDSLIN